MPNNRFQISEIGQLFENDKINQKKSYSYFHMEISTHHKFRQVDKISVIT